MNPYSNQISAEQGKDSFFKNWWLFDTNCISELVKIWDRNQHESIEKFVSGKDILIVSSVVQELRKAPDILRQLDTVLENANMFLAPDVTRFWYTDVINFHNQDARIPINSLQVQSIPQNFFETLLEKSEFEDACLDAEENVQNRFFDTIELDIGSNLDERDLCIYIFSVVNKLGKEWFQIDIQASDCTPSNFPSFYTYYYTYYFRYAKNQVKPEINDFLDLANCMALPYCERFFGERKFTTILREYVQGRIPPTAFQLAKRLHKKGSITNRQFGVIKKNKALFNHTSPLLPNVEIMNFTEMCESINKSAS